MYKNLAKNIRYLRKEMTLTQKQLGQKIHISHSTISKWEADEVPSLDHLKKLAQFFGVKYNDLVDKDLTSVLKVNSDSGDVIFYEKIEEYDDDFLIINSVAVKLEDHVQKNVVYEYTRPKWYKIIRSIVTGWRILFSIAFFAMLLSLAAELLSYMTGSHSSAFDFDSLYSFFCPAVTGGWLYYVSYTSDMLMVGLPMIYFLACIIWMVQAFLTKINVNSSLKKHQRKVSDFRFNQINKHKLIHKKGVVANKIIHTKNNFTYKRFVDEIIDGFHRTDETVIISVNIEDILFIEEVKHYKSPDEYKIKFTHNHVNEKLSSSASISLWKFLNDKGMVEHRVNDKYIITEAFRTKEQEYQRKVEENKRLSQLNYAAEKELAASRSREKDALREAGHYKRKYNEFND